MQTVILHPFGAIGFIFVGRVQNLILHPFLNPFSFKTVHFYVKGANFYFAPFFAPFFLRVCGDKDFVLIPQKAQHFLLITPLTRIVLRQRVAQPMMLIVIAALCTQ